MELRILRREMNQLFNRAEAVEKILNKFGGKSIGKKAEREKRKNQKKAESQSTTGK